MTAFLSGEMRDTVELHPAGSWVLEKVCLSILKWAGLMTVLFETGEGKAVQTMAGVELDVDQGWKQDMGWG
jgi:hypothetical protein